MKLMSIYSTWFVLMTVLGAGWASAPHPGGTHIPFELTFYLPLKFCIDSRHQG